MCPPHQRQSSRCCFAPSAASAGCMHFCTFTFQSRRAPFRENCAIFRCRTVTTARRALQKAFIATARCERGMSGMPLTAERIYSSAETLNKVVDPFALQKVPTGIADLDAIVDGGFPEGSLVLLLGDIGAGMQEYVYTAGSKLALVSRDPELRHYFLGHACDDSVLPERICYVTFSRSREAILQEIGGAFNVDFLAAFQDFSTFKDFSGTYFRNSVVPAGWTHEDSAFGAPSENILENLVAFLDENAPAASGPCISRSSRPSSHTCPGRRSRGSRSW